MEALVKQENGVVKNFYTGSKMLANGQKRTVNCILDDNCVRYIVFVGNRVISRKEYGNDKKTTCFNRTVAALNK